MEMQVTITEKLTLVSCTEPGKSISRSELIQKSEEIRALKGKANAERLRDKPEIQAILKRGYHLCFVDEDGIVWFLYWLGELVCLRRYDLGGRFACRVLLVCPSK